MQYTAQMVCVRLALSQSMTKHASDSGLPAGRDA